MSKDIWEEKIQVEELDGLIGEKFGNYSKYIIQERALPDLRDGLKPVQRRILYAMYKLNLFNNSAYKKSARVVGDVIGKYHPHGDSSVYEAMVRLGQEWKVNIPLVDMHGNKGSVDGDSPAAMRYTEARLGKISNLLLKDIEKKIIDYIPNFDDSELEPIVLPSKFPNLLVNGSMGIASGYSTNIPPHNIGEVLNALIYLYENKETSLKGVMEYINGPDFPTGGIVSSFDAIKNSYKEGKGKIVISSKWKYIKLRNVIEITEIPYEANKADIVRKIDELIRENRVPGVKEVRDDTDRSGLLITLICKDKVDVDLVVNFLFKVTDLRKNFSLNMVAIKDKKPYLMGLLEILESFKDFQIETYKKLFLFELNRLSKRLEIIEGLKKVVPIIDGIIESIKNSINKSDAKKNIIEKFSFTENQAEAIVNLKLYRLTSTDLKELNEEYESLVKLIKHFKKGVKDKNYLIENIVKDIKEILKEYNVERKTLISKEEIKQIKIDEKDLIQEEEVYISITYHGYIKKMSTRSIELSEEKNFGKRNDDILISLTKNSNLKNLVLFSSSGRYFVIPIFKLEDSKWKTNGEHISKFTSLDALDRIVAIDFIDDFNKEGEFIISTKNGMIKRSLISDFNINQSKRGSKYINLKEDDRVVSVSIIDRESFVSSITRNGYAVKYSSYNITTTGLNSAGVKNMSLQKNDYVVTTVSNSLEEVDNEKSEILVITHNGKAKRIKIKNLKTASRATQGTLIAIKSKSNPYQIINGFDVNKIQDHIQVLTIEEHSFSQKVKGVLKISDPTTGLIKITDEKIRLAFGESKLFMDKLNVIDNSGFKSVDDQKETSNNPKQLEIDLEKMKF